MILDIEILGVSGAYYDRPSTVTVTGNYDLLVSTQVSFALTIACRSSTGGNLPSRYFRESPEVPAKKAGSGVFVFKTTCDGGVAWIGRVEPTSPGNSPNIYYYPPGSPSRSDANPTQSQGPAGTLLRKLSCRDSSGKVTEVGRGAMYELIPGKTLPLLAASCPAGSSPVSFSSWWIPADGSPAQVLTPSTKTPDWVANLPRDYPKCATATCEVALFQTEEAGLRSCGFAASDCPDWYVAAARSSYVCKWGSYEVALHYCSVYRDPGTVLPNAHIGSDGSSSYEQWPPLELGTQVVARLIGRLADRYGADACAALGEAVRQRVPATSVPDAVLVCEHLGISTALQWILRVSPDHLAPLVEALVESADGQPITILEPDCIQLSADGRCLDEEGPESEPEPQPDPSGSGVRPPPNCLDDVGRQQLIDSMDREDHHMATHYGLWGAKFQMIASKYGLNVKTGAWNLRSMPHAGPHPWNYHNWVIERMQEADDYAQQFPTEQRTIVFLAEFQREVVDVVLEDPTVVRAAYWKCRDYYKWR